MPKQDRRINRLPRLTFTYRDNPYTEGTKEYDIWYTAFVHGLNSASRDLSAFVGKVGVLLSDALKHDTHKIRDFLPHDVNRVKEGK